MKRFKSPGKVNLWHRLRQRGVLRVAFSYAVIAWLALQIGDVVLDPLGAPPWVMLTLITAALVGFPVALVLAWFFEITPGGIERDRQAEDVERPTVGGIRHYADIVIIGTLLLVVGFLLVRQEGLIPNERVNPVVAILPFEELDSSEDNHFGDGFADTLIHKLGMLDQLVVLASSSTFQFREAGLDLTDAATRLGANVLLQGSMRRAGGLLRLDARLLDGASRQQLWSGSFRRPIEDVFQLQDEIVNAIASTLSLQLSTSQVERINRPPTKSLAAYDTFLRASREALESRDQERMPEALGYLYDAIEMDPDFALAHATLVEAMHLTASYRSWDTKWSDFATEARASAARAQELDPKLGEGYLAEAFVVMWERDVGITQHSDEHLIALTEKALELSPNNASALKMLSTLVDEPERGLELLTRAARIDPRSGIIRLNIAEIYARTGNYDKAEHWAIRSARATDPYFNRGYKFLAELNIWNAGRPDRAARWGRAFESSYPEDWASHLGYVRALVELGAWKEAEDLLDRTSDWADTGDVYMGWIYAYFRQWLAYAQGDTAKAIRLAERYIRENLQTTPDWPDLSGLKPYMLRCFELLALVDLSRGKAQAALDRYRNAQLDPERMAVLKFDYMVKVVPQGVMYAVLLRHTGQADESDRLLREQLSLIVKQAVGGDQGKGFAEFTIHAFLGEADAAIVALQAAVDEGWLPGWWGLKFGAFDENYAAVLEDPRFERLYQQIFSRVTEMRESFQTNPNLPQELLLEAGLTTPLAAQ